jgi:thioredoxin 1
MPEPDLLVVCLCARWCGVCRDYDAVFRQVASRFPRARVVWLDVEDEADLLDPIEVENFPTLLIAGGAEPRFFGTITPHAGTIERIVRESVSGTALAGPALSANADLRALVGRLSDRH